MIGFDHLVISSFKERLDHVVTQKLSAFKNVTVPLFIDSKDDKKSTYKLANGGTNQWVYDSSISGATIASTSGLSGAWQNSKVDFKNSRIIAAGNVTASPPATLAVAQKHFNIYVSSASDEDLFVNVKFGQGDEVLSQTAAVRADSFYAPCVFVKLSKTFNEGFSIGGLDKTYYDIKVTAFVRTEAELIALAGVIRDMKNTATYVLDETPLNEFNDLKTRPWSFNSKMGEMAGLGQPKIIIEDSYFNPLKSDVLSTKFPNVFIGVGTFKVFVTRYPRQ